MNKQTKFWIKYLTYPPQIQMVIHMPRDKIFKMADENEVKIRPFDPKEHGLNEDFRLINFTKLKG